LSAEDPASFWQRVYKTESIDSEEAKKLFVKFAKKKLFYGTKPAKTGTTDQIHPSVALTIELFTLVERYFLFYKNKILARMNLSGGKNELFTKQLNRTRKQSKLQTTTIRGLIQCGTCT
jgi:hypothetical protein